MIRKRNLLIRILLFLLSPVVLLAQKREASVANDTETVQGVISKYVGVYTRPPNTVGSLDAVTKVYRVPNGPLMGNGDMAVAVGGNYQDQTFYLSKSDMSQSKRGVGGLTYTFKSETGDTTKYRQEQDIYKAEVRSILPFSGSTVQMSSWVADQGNVLVTDIWITGNVPVDVTVDLWSHSSSATTQAGTNKGVIWSTREMTSPLGSPPQAFSSKVALATRILGATPKCETDGKLSSKAKFTLQPGKTVRIVTVEGGGYQATDHIADAIAKVTALNNRALDLLYVNHESWWKNYWAKSYINISDELIEKFYYGSLYELGCATREGAIAPGLAGPWHLNGGEVWGNRYTLNYNFVAPWWGVYSSNRAELAMPFYDAILKLIPAGEKLALDNGTKGIWFSVNAHAWGGFTDLRTLNQKGNASMSAMNFMMYYDYTQDENFLVNKAWPLLKELDLFWQDNLTWDEAGHRWIINNSGAREGQKDTNPNNDLSFVKKLYKFLLETSTTLNGKTDQGGRINITAAQKEKWQNYAENLSRFPTMDFNGKTVFKEAESRSKMNLGGPGDNTDVLTHVFPGGAVSMGSDPELIQIARNTVDALNSNPAKESWFQANSVSKIYEQAVRSGYSAQIVTDKLKQLLSGKQPYNDRGDHVYLRNNLTMVSPAHGWESVAIIEAINSMLLQSQDNIIRIFPVWIKGKDAWYKNLRAYGAFLVSSEYKQGSISYVNIKSEAGRECHLMNPWPGKNVSIIEINLTKNKAVDFKLVKDQIVFNTGIKKEYRLVPGL